MEMESRFIVIESGKLVGKAIWQAALIPGSPGQSKRLAKRYFSNNLDLLLAKTAGLNLIIMWRYLAVAGGDANFIVVGWR